MADIVLSMNLYHQAEEERKTFSQKLEELDPSPDGSSLDAFERQLKKHGIITKTMYEKGIMASPVEAFYRTDDTKVLFPEFVARGMRTAFVNAPVLPYLIGQRTIVPTDAVKHYYLDVPDSKKTRKRRVTEASELPKATIKPREQNVRFYKYGMALEASYEAVRRMAVDMLQRHVQFIGLQAAEDKVDEIVNVLLNGDGNNNAAPVYKLTDLDPETTAGKLTPVAWVKFLMLFKIFPADTVIASEEAFVKILLSQFPNLTISEMVALLKQGNTQGIRLVTPQLPRLTQTLLWHESVPDMKAIAFNRDNAIEEYTEAGSDISEAARFIMNQTTVLTISENSGYSKMFKEAVNVLDLNA